MSDPVKLMLTPRRLLRRSLGMLYGRRHIFFGATTISGWLRLPQYED